LPKPASKGRGCCWLGRQAPHTGTQNFTRPGAVWQRGATRTWVCDLGTIQVRLFPYLGSGYLSTYLRTCPAPGYGYFRTWPVLGPY
jgi:hypothetical protein